MHQLFIVNGDPGARNSVDRIFIGEEPLQQLWRSGEFSSRMRFFFFLTIFLGQSMNVCVRVAWRAWLFHLIFPCTNIVLRLGPHTFSNGPFLSKSIYFTKTFIRTFTETLIIIVDCVGGF